MPKIVSEEERKLTKEAIYDKTVDLIRSKGLRAVTVDDIAGAVGIGKGSFYAYFPSREVCLYKTVLRFEKAALSRLESIFASGSSDRDKTIAFLNEVFVSQDSLASAVNPVDKEALLRKLPAEYREAEKGKSVDHMQSAIGFLSISPGQMEVVALLMDCLAYMASNNSYSKEGIEKTQALLIDTIADFIYARSS